MVKVNTKKQLPVHPNLVDKKWNFSTYIAPLTKKEQEELEYVNLQIQLII